MDLEDLNKYQLILLTLLISFVTSMATGIITVSLLQQAPIQVSGAINKVIERTIEKVTPSTDQTKIQTVVIKEDDLVSEALATGAKGVARLLIDVPGTDVAPSGTSLLALGALVDGKGIVVVPGVYKKESGAYVELMGKRYEIASITSDAKSDISVIHLSLKDGKLVTFDTQLIFESSVRPGQTALVIGSGGKFVKTLISDVTTPTKPEDVMFISLADPVALKMFGAPVISNEGKLIGLIDFDISGAMSVLGFDSLQKVIIAELSKPKI